MTGREWLRALLPPLLLQVINRRYGRGLRFEGHPASWAEARTLSSGYSSAEILERVVAATRAVVAGKAAFERDSVLFESLEPPYPLLSALLRAAALNRGQLQVVDFGGSLGSTFRQCHALLAGLDTVRWHVVEQSGFVAAGQREFTTDQLDFFSSPDALPPLAPESVILLSSVLQYLESPREVLQALARLPSRHLVIDRTPLLADAQDRLCIQHVPKEIYPASYPCWLLSRPLLLATLARDWQVLCEFSCPEGHCRTADGQPFEFRGFILERRP